MSFVFFFIALVCVAILFTDSKINPADNAIIRVNNALCLNPIIAQLFLKIEPYSLKFGAPPLLALIIGLCVFIFVCAVIF